MRGGWLPSGNVWAPCNIGANSPEGLGDRFQWGAISKVAPYAKWSNYRFGEKDSLTKYLQPFDSLELEDDIVNLTYGGNWQIPTPEDWMELASHSHYQDYTLNNVKGVIYWNKNLGEMPSLDECLFFPKAGYAIDNVTNGSVGSLGRYWSNQISDENYYAQGYGLTDVMLNDCSRCGGYSVRGVLHRYSY